MNNIPMQSDGSQPETSGRRKNHDIFTDPKIAAAAENDPTFEILKKNWKNIALTMAAALVTIYFIQSFQESYEASMKSSADIFHRIQSGYQEFQSVEQQLISLNAQADDNEEKALEIKTQLNDLRSQLEQLLNSAADSREPYKTMSVLYRGLLNKNENPELAAGVLQEFKYWQQSKAGSEKRLFAELGALQLAKILLENPEQADEGRELLKSLVSEGEFSSVSAANTLATFASNEEEKSEADKLIKSLMKRQPEHSHLLKESLKLL